MEKNLQIMVLLGKIIVSFLPHNYFGDHSWSMNSIVKELQNMQNKYCTNMVLDGDIFFISNYELTGVARSKFIYLGLNKDKSGTRNYSD